MRIVSVCSGAGGMDLGFHNAGHRTGGLCEWDGWRRKLLAARFPGVPIHPDLAELADWCERDPAAVREWFGGQPDVLIGGTPCQDLSVAGLRAGLDGERSVLYWAYQRVRLALGVEWAVWENVAGALSSNGGVDFASVLGAFVGADVHVPTGGWPGAGVAAGPWGGAGWRVLDAQHFGVPQRRRRVFVVGRLGGPCPPEVLLERAGCGRHPATRGGEGPGASGVAAPLTRGSSRDGVSEPGRRQEDDVNLVAGTLRVDSDASDGQLVSHTLRAGGFDASEDGTGRGTPLVTHPQGARLQQLEPGDGGSDARPPGLDGSPADADGVRAADGLAGHLDSPVSEPFTFDWQMSSAKDKSRGGKSRAWIEDKPGTARALGTTKTLAVFGADGRPAEACALDPQPDGRRYAACGDGVVAPVAEWIGRRLAAAIEGGDRVAA